MLKDCYRPLDGISSEMRWVIIIPPFASRLPLSLQLSNSEDISFSDYVVRLVEKVGTNSTLVSSLERQNMAKDERMREDELERVSKDTQLISQIDEVISKDKVLKPQGEQPHV